MLKTQFNPRGSKELQNKMHQHLTFIYCYLHNRLNNYDEETEHVIITFQFIYYQSSYINRIR